MRQLSFDTPREELTTSQKNALTGQFDEQYGDAPEAFLEYIKYKEFAVPGDYAETWALVESGLHSLERWSNFHLYFWGWVGGRSLSLASIVSLCDKGP